MGFVEYCIANTTLDVQLYGGSTPQEAKHIFDSVLEGTSTDSQRTAVAINAAFAIQLMDAEKSIRECLDMAFESIDSKRALTCLQKLIEIYQ